MSVWSHLLQLDSIGFFLRLLLFTADVMLETDFKSSIDNPFIMLVHDLS